MHVPNWISRKVEHDRLAVAHMSVAIPAQAIPRAARLEFMIPLLSLKDADNERAKNTKNHAENEKRG